MIGKFKVGDIVEFIDEQQFNDFLENNAKGLAGWRENFGEQSFEVIAECVGAAVYICPITTTASNARVCANSRLRNSWHKKIQELL